MKKFAIILSSALLILASAVSCSSGSSPKVVATAFLTKLNASDFTGASEYCTSQGAENLKMLESLMGMAPPEELAKQKADAKTKKVVIVSVQAEDDKAIVTYTIGESQNQTLNLLKVDGAWKVDFTKEA